jgi:hypothetical protein
MTSNSFYILGNTLKMKHNNLISFNIFFQLLVIENAIHFQSYSFEIGLNVKKFSIQNQEVYNISLAKV